MNWFQKLINNPNAHLIGAGIAAGASKAFPQYGGALESVAGVLLGTGVVLPEQPKVEATPPIVALPPAAGGGSYHGIDYANLAAALLAQFAKKK